MRLLISALFICSSFRFCAVCLRLRGLGFRPRDAREIEPRQLELVDISRSVAVGISVVDVIRGSDYQTRSLLLALKAGEPSRILLYQVVVLVLNGLFGLLALARVRSLRRR